MTFLKKSNQISDDAREKVENASDGIIAISAWENEPKEAQYLLGKRLNEFTVGDQLPAGTYPTYRQ